MSLIDPIGDMFTRIRNGQMRNLDTIVVPHSKFRINIFKTAPTTDERKAT